MLETLWLQNFKAFREVEIPLRPLTLLTGLNSSGKSTVLQALALLRQSYELVPASMRRVREGRRPIGPTDFILNGDLVELGTGQDVLHENFVETPGSGPLIGVGFSDQEVASGGELLRWQVGYVPDSDVLPVVSGPPKEGVDQWPPNLFQSRFQYLTADRIVPAVSYPRSYQVAIGRGFLGTRGEHAVNYLRHHTDRAVRSEPLRHPGAKSDLLLDQVNAWMQELCPGVNVEAVGIEGMDSVRLSYGFGYSSTSGLNTSRRRRPTHVGFGLTYVLPIVVACLTSDSGALLLLENPEAHLHPRGQSRMAALIAAAASAGAQVIVETHSDHVLNGVRIAVKQRQLPPDDVAVHFFQGDGAEVRIASPAIGPDGMLSEWPLGFFDEWDQSLDQLLD